MMRSHIDEPPVESTTTWNALPARLRRRASSMRRLHRPTVELPGHTTLLLDEAADAIEERDARLAIAHRDANRWAIATTASLSVIVVFVVLLIDWSVSP